MKCIYCNFEIPAGSPNCPRCGSPAAAQPAQTPAPQQGQYAPQPGQYAPQPGQYVPQPGQYAPQPGQYAPQQGQYAPQQGQYAPQPGQYAPQPAPPAVPKSRVLYQALALLFGGLGVHNFYAGRTVIGVIQLLITLIGGVVPVMLFDAPGIAALPIFIWVLGEIFLVKKDGRGIPMK